MVEMSRFSAKAIFRENAFSTLNVNEQLIAERIDHRFSGKGYIRLS
jgi:hypothetical protein